VAESGEYHDMDGDINSHNEREFAQDAQNAALN